MNFLKWNPTTFTLLFLASFTMMSVRFILVTEVSVVCSFILLRSIPLYAYTSIICPSLLMGMCSFSAFIHNSQSIQAGLSPPAASLSGKVLPLKTHQTCCVRGIIHKMRLWLLAQDSGGYKLMSSLEPTELGV